MGKRKSSVKAVGKRNFTLADLLSRGVERKAFDELTNEGGVDAQELFKLLATISHAPNSPMRMVEGMSDASVRRLPQRIRDFAGTIDSVNASPWVGANIWRGRPDRKGGVSYPPPLNKITDGKAEYLIKCFLSLPLLLRLYAGVLGEVLNRFHPTGDRKKELSHRAIRPRTFYTIKLLYLVKRAAGSPCYEQVATLLTRANELAGLDRIISAGDLAHLISNNDYFALLAHLEYFG